MSDRAPHKHQLGIVIPVYKLREEYLNHCIKSVLDQGELDIEIVLVDDCSPDNCGALCDVYAANNDSIRVVHHKKNMGLPAARNTGLSVLNSEWVSFVDGDDWVESNTFIKIINRLSTMNTKPDFVMFPGCLSYKDREITDQIYLENQWRDKEAIHELQILALSLPLKVYPDRAVAYDTAWAKVISYDYLMNNHILFRDLPYREDGMFFQELVEHASCIEQFSIGMYHYRMTEGSMVHSYRSKAPEEQLKYLNMLWEFGIGTKKPGKYFDALYSSALVSMQVCITCYFYHRQHQAKNAKKECEEYFSQKPYKDVYKHVKLCKLKRNFLLKALLIYTKNYNTLNSMREYYLKRNSFICFE